jgi:hypothetical protein
LPAQNDRINNEEFLWSFEFIPKHEKSLQDVMGKVPVDRGLSFVRDTGYLPFSPQVHQLQNSSS